MKYKGLIKDSLDHPDGLATLIIAPGCSRKCPSCINKHLHTYPVLETNAEELVDQILDNSINNRVVLSGLEWSEDIDNLLEILQHHKKLNIILYTHWDESSFKKKYPFVLSFPIWIKYGEYDPILIDHFYCSQGIPLASKNQYIKKNIPDL